MKIDIFSIVNKILLTKRNIIKIKFRIEDKEFNVSAFDDEIFGAVKDILLNREYEYIPDFELINFRGKRIVDAGANIGLFSLIASKFGKEVIAIEPHPLNYKLLKTNKIENGIKNIVILNKALWFKKKKVRLYEGTHSGSHSLLSKTNSGAYEVQTTTLKEIVENFGDIDLLKIDIEGSELEVIINTNPDTLKRIRSIVCEIHGEKNVSPILKFLKMNGFAVKLFNPPLVKKSGSYRIEVNDLFRLKILRAVIYTIASLAKIRDKDLTVLFAVRDRSINF